MTYDFRRAALSAGAVLAAAAIAGCGSSTSKSGATSSHDISGTAATTHDMQNMTHGQSGHSGTSGGHMQGMTALEQGADGTAATAGGLTLKPQATTIAASKTAQWSLRIVDKHGMPVTRFERDQTKLLHLIVVRSDFSRYQHLHPALGGKGRFTVAMRLPEPGKYRAIADFTTAGKRYALGTTITVPGTAAKRALLAARTTSAVDGYDVTVQHGAIAAGQGATLTFGVTRGGKPVSALEPYLGAFGHLVALHVPDLAYSHVHPVSSSAKGGKVTFDADFPRAGRYGTFLQFRAGGVVHTAPFTVVVGA